MVKIRLNGETREVGARNLAALIEEIGLDPGKVAVEKNLEIAPRSAWLATAVDEGDRLEIVQFVGGG